MARSVTPEQVDFPLAAQAARVHRQRNGQHPETVCLLTSLPEPALAAQAWLTRNIAHWGIETGLHARLDASRHDDCCRLRERPAVWLHRIFNRWAKSLFIAWRSLQPNSRHQTTTDFIAHTAEDRDRRAVFTLTARSPRFRRLREEAVPATRRRAF